MAGRLLIFDLDGTLVSTDYAHRDIVIKNTLAELGKATTPFYIEKFWFEGKREELIRDVFGIEPDEFWHVYGKYDTVDVRRKYTHPFWDTSFLSQLKKKGHLLTIMTAAPEDIANLEIGMIEKITGKGIFDKVVLARSDKGFKPKPDPQSVQYCLDYFGYSRENSCVIGNSDEDIGAAKNAGVMPVQMYRREYDFLDLSPFVMINSTYALNHVANLYMPPKPGKFF